MSDAPKCPTYLLGAATWLELSKEAKKAPAFTGFLDPEIFSKSLGWFQTKRKRGYTDEQAARFLAGFAAAREVARDGR